MDIIQLEQQNEQENLFSFKNVLEYNWFTMLC